MTSETGKKILAAVEAEVKALIEANCTAVVDAAITALEKVIPGSWDNAILEGAKPQIEASVKAALLKLADGISKEA